MKENVSNDEFVPYIIETKDLTKIYHYKKAVDHVSIHIRKGEIYGLIGKNGAGKTTLLKLLLGFIKPNEGEMKIFGGEDFQTSRLRIGSLIEAPGLYRNETGRQNLLDFATLYGSPTDEVDELLKLVGLEHVGKKKVKAYSLGMKQRLGLAVALLGKPDILLLDEPINGLDPEGIMSFRQIVEKIHQERDVTMIISSHLLDELGKVATKYGIINNGVLVEEKTIEEIKELCGSFLKIETSDNQKALKLLNSNFKGINCSVENDHIVIKNGEDYRAKINALLIKEGLDIFSSSIETNDLESFFVERLK